MICLLYYSTLFIWEYPGKHRYQWYELSDFKNNRTTELEYIILLCNTHTFFNHLEIANYLEIQLCNKLTRLTSITNNIFQRVFNHMLCICQSSNTCLSCVWCLTSTGVSTVQSTCSTCTSSFASKFICVTFICNFFKKRFWECVIGEKNWFYIWLESTHPCTVGDATL